MLSTLLKATSRRTSPVYVGGYFYGFLGTTSTTNISLTSLTGGLAAAPAENDIVVVAYSVGSTIDENLSVTGYAEIADIVSGGTYLANLSVHWKKMTASPDTSITVSSTGNVANAAAVAIHVWRGQDLTTPWDTDATTDTGTSTGDVNPPAINPPIIGSVILCAGSFAANGTGTLTAGYLSNFVTGSSNDTYDSVVGMGSVLTTGAYNPAAWTAGAGPTGPNWAAVTMALRGA